MGRYNRPCSVQYYLTSALLIVALAATVSFFTVVVFLAGVRRPTTDRGADAETMGGSGEEMRMGEKILVLLPKDNTTNGDYGSSFRDGWLEDALNNRREYANNHGYSFMWANLANYPEFRVEPQWAKIAALHHAFAAHPTAEWIWILDSDAIIMNASISLESHLLSPSAMKRAVIPSTPIKFGGTPRLRVHTHTATTAPHPVDPSSIFLLISQDANGLNTGSLFVRRNAFMAAFVDLWRDPYLIRNRFTFNEQDGLAHLLLAHPDVARHVGVVEQRLVNTYPNRYERGDLLVHFAGCRRSVRAAYCDALFYDFWLRRTVAPKDVG